MYKQLKKLAETKTKQSIESYTTIKAKVDIVKENRGISGSNFSSSRRKRK
jgi:hypothetical protein